MNALNSFWGRSFLYALSGIVLMWALYHSGERFYHYLIKPNPDISRMAGAHGQTELAPKVRLADIQSANLFGRKPVQAVTQKPKATTPKTRLKLILEGIISTGDEGSARAIIAERGKLAWPYAVGDKIRGTDAIVDSIELHQVIIDRSGRLEKLEMNIPVLNFKIPEKMPTARFVSAEEETP